MRYRVHMTGTEVSTHRPWLSGDDGMLRSPLLTGLGLVAGFTTRRWGTMGDAETPREIQQANRAAVAAHLGFPEVVRSRQVHGTSVVRVDADFTPWPEADSLWSDEPGVLLGIAGADCVPILVADPDGRAIGVAHGGWRGTSEGVATALVVAMRDAGIPMQRLVAALGPSIGPCCYTIGPERVELVAERLGPGNEDIVADGRMDLWLANERQLRAAGIETVEVSGICTRCGGADVWSYRGRTPDAPYGTCLGFIGWSATSDNR